MVEAPPEPTAPAITPSREVETLLRRTRVRWVTALWLRALMAAAVTAAALTAALVWTDLVRPLPAATRLALRWVPLLVGAVPLAWAAVRTLRLRRASAFVYLVEEHVPALQNRLATWWALRGEPVGPLMSAFAADLILHLPAVRPAAVVPMVPPRPLLALAALVGAGSAALAAAPASHRVLDRWLHPRDSASPVIGGTGVATTGPTSGARAPIPATFGRLRWRVLPPAYTGLSTVRLDDAVQLAAPVGSRLEIRGDTHRSWQQVHASWVAGDAIPIVRSRGSWRANARLGPEARGIWLRAYRGQQEVAARLVPVSAVPDRPPLVTLRLPTGDLVLASATGMLPLRAHASDDYGIADLRFAWVRSRGGGESFAFQEGEWRPAQVEVHGRSTSARLTLDLKALGLEPGDVLHLRAMARDRNPSPEAPEGSSETRILRIARQDEMETVTTPIGMPPEAERNPILSQRMLILLTERLRAQARQLAAGELRQRAAELAREQGRLRTRVGELLFGPGASEEGHTADDGHAHPAGEPIVTTGPLLPVYNAMWSAERELGIGDPAASLPHQHEALRGIQRLREAERQYVRAQPVVPPVDVAAVRGTGKPEGIEPAARVARPQPDPDLNRDAALRAVEAAFANPTSSAAAASLATAAAALLAADANPQAGALLARAADAVRRGETARARSLLRRVRTTLRQDRARASATGISVPTDPVGAEYLRRLSRGAP